VALKLDKATPAAPLAARFEAVIAMILRALRTGRL